MYQIFFHLEWKIVRDRPDAVKRCHGKLECSTPANTFIGALHSQVRKMKGLQMSKRISLFCQYGNDAKKDL